MKEIRFMMAVIIVIGSIICIHLARIHSRLIESTGELRTLNYNAQTYQEWIQRVTNPNIGIGRNSDH